MQRAMEKIDMEQSDKFTIDATYEEIQEEFEKFLNKPDTVYDKSLDWKYWSDVADHNYSDAVKFQKYYEGFLAGSSLCSQMLGEMYISGSGVEEDYGVASYYFGHSAKRGNAASMTYLAMAYFLDGDELFYEEAMQWISKAVILGDGKGYVVLAGWVKSNQGIRNYVECCLQKHYEKTVKKDAYTKEDYRFLGWCFWTGVCCEKNRVKAKEIWDEGGKKDLTCKTLYMKLSEKEKTECSDFVPAFDKKEKKTQDNRSFTGNSGTESTIQKQTNDSKISREIPEDRIATQETLKNHSKIFSIIAIVLALFAVNPLMCIVAFCCALWAKKKQEKWAKATLIVAAIAFVLCLL